MFSNAIKIKFQRSLLFTLNISHQSFFFLLLVYADDIEVYIRISVIRWNDGLNNKQIVIRYSSCTHISLHCSAFIMHIKLGILLICLL